MQDAPEPTRPRSSGWIAAAAVAAFALGLFAHPLLFRDEPSEALRSELADLNARVAALNEQMTGSLAALREGELAEIQRGLTQLDQRMGETERALRAAGAGGGPVQAAEVSADDDPALGPADAPVLIVHGSKDWMVPAEHGEALHKADPEQSKLLVIDGDGHVGVYFDADGQVRDAGLDWLDRHLTEQRTPTTPFP